MRLSVKRVYVYELLLHFPVPLPFSTRLLMIHYSTGDRFSIFLSKSLKTLFKHHGDHFAATRRVQHGKPSTTEDDPLHRTKSSNRFEDIESLLHQGGNENISEDETRSDIYHKQRPYTRKTVLTLGILIISFGIIFSVTKWTFNKPDSSLQTTTSDSVT